MLQTLVALVTRKLVVITILLLVVAVIPVTAQPVTSGDEKIAARQVAGQKQAFSSDGDALISRLQHAESTCDLTLVALVKAAGLSADDMGPILDTARAKLDAGVAPLVARVQTDEAEITNARVFTKQELADQRGDLALIQATALSNAESTGTVAVLCQEIRVEVEQGVAAAQRRLPGGGAGGDGD